MLQYYHLLLLQVSLSKIEPLRESDKEDEIKRLKLLRSERRLVQEGFDKALVVREEIRKNINVHSSVHEHLHQVIGSGQSGLTLQLFPSIGNNCNVKSDWPDFKTEMAN